MGYSLVRARKLDLLVNNRAVVIFPYWAIVVLTLAGLAAFSSVGFWGYLSDGQPLYPLAHPVVVLFLWFSVMIISIQLSIFRAKDREIRSWRWQTLVVTLICIACGFVAYVKPDIVNDILTWLGHTSGTQKTSETVLLNAVNFLPLAIYLGDRFWLWVTRQRKRQADDLASRRADASSNAQIPASFWKLDTWEVASQDFFGGATLALALSVLLREDILNGLLGALPIHFASNRIDRCSVSWAFSVCQTGATNNPPTLSGIDLSVGLILLLISLIILVAHLIPRVITLVLERAVKNVAQAIIRTLLAIFNPLDVLLRTLRVVLWPFFVAVGIFAVAFSAHYIRLYLHLLSDKRTCTGSNSCPDLREFGAYLSNSLDPAYFQSHAIGLELMLVAIAVLAGILAILAILVAAQVLVFGRVDRLWPITNWLRFMALLGTIIACFYWILSLILSIFMWALQSLNLTARTPFPQPSTSGGISLVILIALFIASRPKFPVKWFQGVWSAMGSVVIPPGLSEANDASEEDEEGADTADTADTANGAGDPGDPDKSQ